METTSWGRGGYDFIAKWQDPHLPIIAMSCRKCLPGLLRSPQIRLGPLREERCWENPLAQPEGGIDAGSVAAQVMFGQDGERQAFTFPLL